MDNNNRKQSVWLYSVILFTSAFIVLLFTAYSQIKLKKNLENYKSQVFNTESEKEMYQRHYASAQEMNEELNKEIKELKNEISLLKNEISELDSKNKEYELQQIKKNNALKVFSEALILYVDGNAAGCFDLLDTIDANDLGDESGAAYEVLKSESAFEAGKELFEEGYELYRKARYEDAAATLSRSYKYAPEEEFSDRCLYYLAYSRLNTGEKAEAVTIMKTLADNFPESKYLSKARKFISRYEQKQ